MFNDNIEWLEYYSNGFFNLSNFKIKDNSQTDSLECCFSNCSFFVENEFFLIFAKNNETYLFLEKNNFTKKENIKFFCVDDNLIGNGLSNNNDEIILFNENYKINITYNIENDFSIQNIEKGKTFSFINDLNGFFITEATPFEKNVLINSNEKNNSFNNLSEKISKNLDSIENYTLTNVSFNLNSTYNLNNSITDRNITEKIQASENQSIFKNISQENKTANENLSYNDKNEELKQEKIDIANNSYSISNNTEKINLDLNTYLFLNNITLYNESYFLINFSAYKGNTAKKVIYVYLENNQKNKIKVYADKKYILYNFSVLLNIQNKENTKIIISGLNKTIFYNISFNFIEQKNQNNISFLNQSLNESNIIKNKNIIENTNVLEFDLAENENNNYNIINQNSQFKKSQYVLKNFSLNENTFSAIIEINNFDNITHFYKIFFYAYNNTKKYSNENFIEIEIKKNSTKTINLKNKITKNVSGLIKFKIKLFREDRKTPYEITQEKEVFYFIDEDSLFNNPFYDNSNETNINDSLEINDSFFYDEVYLTYFNKNENQDINFNESNEENKTTTEKIITEKTNQESTKQKNISDEITEIKKEKNLITGYSFNPFNIENKFFKTKKYFFYISLLLISISFALYFLFKEKKVSI
ncbi:MAG: hypothetical protein QXM96_02190 [Candidatus Woesearchaeota archaeon]